MKLLVKVACLAFFICLPASQSHSQYSQRQHEILSKDYQVAKKALDKAVLEKDLETIRLGLKGDSFQIKKDVVSEIVKLNEKSFIPDLIEALENNQGALSGNEVAVLQADLSEAIISAIELFTGLKFVYKLDPSKVPVMDEEDDVQRIIKQSRIWWEANKKNYENTETDEILSEDYAIAEKALNKAVLEKNKDTIKLGLKSPILDIRKKTVEAIAKIGDETFVPNLIVALEQNQGIIAGGSEIQSLQKDLNKAIIAALEELTKLKFNISKNLSSEDIDEVMRKSREWCSENKKNNVNTEIKKP